MKDLKQRILTEREESLKKKIFSLPKMEALVFSDPKLTTVYDNMAENGDEKYGYHYNETIMNILFNEYVLNSAKYLQKYKAAVPKRKKRRDKSGINTLKKDIGGDELEKKEIDETTSAGSVGGSAGYVGYSTPAAWAKSKKPMSKPLYIGGTLAESTKNSTYLTNPQKFKLIAESLDESNGEMYVEYYKQMDGEKPFVIRGEKWEYVWAKYPNNKIDIGVYRFGQDLTYSYEWFNNTILNRNINEEAVSKAQQRFMGMVHAVQTGKLKPSEVSKSVAKAANDMSKKSVIDFASTKHENLPELVSEEFFSYDSALNKIVSNSETEEELTDIIRKALIRYGITDEKTINSVVDRGKRMYEKKIIDETSIIDANETSIKSNNQPLNNQSQNMEMGMNLNVSEDSNINRPEYGFYIVNPKNRKIYSGFEYKEDANEIASEIGGVKVYSKSFLIKNNINPDDDINWSNLDENLGDEFNMYESMIKNINEDRKTSSLIMKDRIGNDNEKNFKSDLNHSGTMEEVKKYNDIDKLNSEKETIISKDPQKLGKEIESKSKKESFKNVGNSANEKGDEIPKRNMTDEEVESVDTIRGGMEDVAFDNKPDKRYEDRMKTDMGDDIYKKRQEKLKIKSEMPMYNKDKQPIDDAKEGDTLNKYYKNLSETIIGKYSDFYGKNKFINFDLSKVIISENILENYTKLTTDGVGNTYLTTINESTGKFDKNYLVNEIMNNFNFYINENNEVFAIKNNKQLNENSLKGNIGNYKHFIEYSPRKYNNL